MTCSPNLGNLLFHPRTGSILAIDVQAETTLNIGAAELDHCDLGDIFLGLTPEKLAAILDQNDKPSRNVATLISGPGGCEQSVKIHVVPLAGPQQDLLLLTLHPAIAKPNEESQRDALTGLPDRRGLVAYHQQWQLPAEVEENFFAVLFMDLEQFKQVNDQHGHAAGDQVLSTLAQRWQDCVRDDDLVARYGGDEFVVLLTGINSRAEVEPVIARLTQVTSDPISVDDQQLSVGVTIGMAVAQNDSTTLEELIAAADREMYALRRSR